MEPLPALFRSAIRLQVVYGLLVALWQIVGLLRLASGRAPLGPSASSGVAVFAIVSVGLLLAIARARPGLYVLLAALLAVPALATILNAFVADPSLWPSPWTRWGGVALNTLGVLAPLLALFGWLRIRSGRERPGDA